MIKITVTGTRGFPGIQGGIENHCEHLYKHLVEKGCEITVFTREPYIKNLIESYKGIRLIPLGCPQNKFLEAIVHTFKSVLKSRKLHPDILHIHAIGPSLFTPLARALGMKVIVTSHGPDYKRKKWSLPAKLFLMFCEWMGMVFADGIISISDNIADDIKRKYKRSSTVIPNGVQIPTLADTDNTLQKYDLLKNKYILSVGRFVPEKGFNDLITAFSMGNSESWKLVIVGDADHEDEFSRDLKMKASKNKNIILTGFLTGKPLHELYTYAGLFVLPSYYEGLPIVLLEAMSYGLLCIVSDIPANKNIELNEDSCFKTGDVRMLSEKLSEFIHKSWSDEDKRRQINIIAEKYSWEVIADETLKVYKHILL